MRAIFKRKMYDTDKSEKLCNVGYTAYSVWITKKGTLFLFNDVAMKICNTNQEKVRNILGEENPEKYIELFGKVEEA